MQLFHENILVVGDKIETQQTIINNQNLLLKFAEAMISSLEKDVGEITNITIRNDLKEKISLSYLKDIGGNSNNPVFAHIINTDNNKYKISMIINIQEQEPPKGKNKTLSFLKKIIHIIFGYLPPNNN